ncbi:hypothetical protein IKW72_05600 [bacterium]|nr:hypothetical protein [bacterium]
MRKSLLLLSFIASFCIFAEDVSVKPAGEGTAENPYLFDRLENFFWLRQNILEMDPEVPVYCKQIKNIDASATQDGGDYAWQTIEFNKHFFVYDGQCYTIYGLEPEEKAALFGTGYFQLKNIRIQGAEGKKTCSLAEILYSSPEKKGFLENCRIKGLIVGSPALVSTVSGSDVRIEDCVVEADIENLEGSGALIQRFASFGPCSIKSSCFKGKIETTNTSIAGLIYCVYLFSNAAVTIEDCYSDFEVSVGSEDVCWFAGMIQLFFPVGGAATNSTVNIERCYISGTLKGSLSANSKAFISDAPSINTLNVKHCYYDETMNLSDDYAMAKTDEEMKQKATFENWDFENVWDIDEDEGMPYLRCEVPEPFGMVALILLLLLKKLGH